MIRNSVVIKITAIICLFYCAEASLEVRGEEYAYRRCVRQIIEQVTRGRVLTCEYKLDAPEREIQGERGWAPTFEYPGGRLYGKSGVRLGVYQGRLISIFYDGEELGREITKNQVIEEMREDHRTNRLEVNDRNTLCYTLSGIYLRFYFDSDGMLLSYSIKH